MELGLGFLILVMIFFIVIDTGRMTREQRRHHRAVEQLLTEIRDRRA
jgi:preprotein translocase subunit YajC